MRLPALGALWAAHKKTILVGGVGGAVGLGLLHRHAATAASGTNPAAVGAALPGDPAANGATIAGYQGPNTAGTDVYNALQPQIEQARNQAAAATSVVTRLRSRLAKQNARQQRQARRLANQHERQNRQGRRLARQHKRQNRQARQLRQLRRTDHHARFTPPPAPHRTTRHRSTVARRGDTVSSLARRNGTNVAALAAYNRGVTRTPIRPGQRIVIPNPQVRT